MMDFAATDGIVNVLKPPGMTSSNVVSDIRRLFSLKRVGHTGTLDPGASGVLPVCIGRATRLFDILVDKQKEYIAEIAFGARTDTQDSYGRLLEASSAKVDEDALIDALEAFKGRQFQTAPAYSALKFEGQSLHSLARKGAEIPERIREIEVFELERIHRTADNRFLLRMVCSRGTYVRTLCEDIGRRLNECAHMSFLLRTRSGSFNIEDSLSISELEALKAEGRLKEAVTPVQNVLDFMPCVQAKQSDMLLNGRAEKIEGLSLGEYYRVYAPEFLGVGIANNEGLKLKLRF